MHKKGLVRFNNISKLFSAKRRNWKSGKKAFRFLLNVHKVFTFL